MVLLRPYQTKNQKHLVFSKVCVNNGQLRQQESESQWMLSARFKLCSESKHLTHTAALNQHSNKSPGESHSIQSANFQQEALNKRIKESLYFSLDT